MHDVTAQSVFKYIVGSKSYSKIKLVTAVYIGRLVSEYGFDECGTSQTSPTLIMKALD